MPLELHSELAYEELECAKRVCDHCTEQRLHELKESGLLAPLIIPIDDKSPNTGYRRAIEGLNTLNAAEVLAGCKEVIAAEQNTTTEYSLNYFRCLILMCHVNCFHQNTFPELIFGVVNKLPAIMCMQTIPVELETSASLCRAQMYDVLDHQQFSNAILDRLALDEPNNPHISLIRSGLLQSRSMPTPHEYQAISVCCALMPNVFFVQYKAILVEYMMEDDLTLAKSNRMANTEKLLETFPNEMFAYVSLAHCYYKAERFNEAERLINDARKKLPDKVRFTYLIQGLLNKMQPSSVDLFIKATVSNPMASTAYRELFEYYCMKTHEYGKALEVINRALILCNEYFDWLQMFEDRQQLLNQIVAENLWAKL